VPGFPDVLPRSFTGREDDESVPQVVQLVTPEVGQELDRRGEAPTDGMVFAAARTAFAHALGTQPVDIGVGGSVAFVTALRARRPDAQIVITGVEDPDTRAHETDESLHLDTFRRSCLTEALPLTQLSET
jgi:hypothetical protein